MKILLICALLVGSMSASDIQAWNAGSVGFPTSFPPSPEPLDWQGAVVGYHGSQWFAGTLQFDLSAGPVTTTQTGDCAIWCQTAYSAPVTGGSIAFDAMTFPVLGGTLSASHAVSCPFQPCDTTYIFWTNFTFANQGTMQLYVDNIDGGYFALSAEAPEPATSPALAFLLVGFIAKSRHWLR